MNKSKLFSSLANKSLVLAAIILFSGVSVAFGALTFSNSSIVGDASFNAITGAASTTLDLAGNTLSLQTTNSGPITTGSGLFTIGGQLSVSNIDRATAGTMTIGNSTSTGITIGRSGQTVSFPGNVSSTALLVTGNATTTNLSITAFNSGCLSASAGGVIATSTCGAGTVTTSTAISVNNFPFWGTTAGALTGTSTLSISGTTLTQTGNFLLSAGSAIDSSAAGTLLIGNTTSTGITIGRSGQTVTLPGSQLVTGPLLFSATGAVIDSNVAGTLLIGNATTTSITIGRSGQTVVFPGNASTTGTFTVGSAGTPILKHLSATSSVTFGIIASTTCAVQTMTVTGANAGDNVYAAPTPVASGIDTVSSTWSVWTTANTVNIRACNPTAANTASVAAQTWRADVWQH